MFARGYFRAGRTCIPAGAPVLFLALAIPAAALAEQNLQPIELPKAQITGGMPLMQALALRRTTRAFGDEALPLQTLSNLLWASFGVNRSRGVKAGLGRTAPSAMNSQDIEIDVVLATGIYIYEAEANQLRPVAAGDARAKICQPGGEKAAVTLVFVAPAKDDFARSMRDSSARMPISSPRPKA